MTEKEKKFLSDISNSIELIETFTRDLQSFSEYQKDLLIVRLFSDTKIVRLHISRGSHENIFAPAFCYFFCCT